VGDAFNASLLEIGGVVRVNIPVPGSPLLRRGAGGEDCSNLVIVILTATRPSSPLLWRGAGGEVYNTKFRFNILYPFQAPLSFGEGLGVRFIRAQIKSAFSNPLTPVP